MKALHPADPITDCRGIPDTTICPTVCINYNLVFRVSAPAGPPAWGFDLTVVPNLLCPGFLRTVDQIGGTVTLSNLLNLNLTPPGVPVPKYSDLLTQLRSLGIEAHRLVYFGVTGYQDGPALADQGTICAAQWHVAPKKYGVQTRTDLTNIESYAARGVMAYQNSDFALYDRSQYLPNAYFGVSKGGVYLPLRLSGNEKWRSDADLYLVANEAVYAPTAGDNMIDIPEGGSGTVPPYPDLVGAHVDIHQALVGDPVYKPLNDLWAGISARNLSPQTNFAFYFRLAIEARVHSTSVYTSQVRMSPAFDPVALASYARIGRELKDAYSSDYNDLGKLWDVIKSVARVVLPAVGMMGPVGAAISGAGQAVMSIVDKSSRRGEANPPPAAAVERMREAQMVMPVAVRSAKKRIGKKTTTSKRK